MQLSRRKESQRNRTEQIFFYSLLSDSQIAQQGVNMTKNERTFDFTETIVSESSLCHGIFGKPDGKNSSVPPLKCYLCGNLRVVLF